MIIKNSKNEEFHFEKISDDSKGSTNLFNCPLCGFHSSTIVKYWVKGFEEQYSLELLSIHPERETKTSSISENTPIYNDGEMSEEYICGKCGGPGCMEKVPFEWLEMYGYEPTIKTDILPITEGFLKNIIRKLISYIKRIF